MFKRSTKVSYLPVNFQELVQSSKVTNPMPNISGRQNTSRPGGPSVNGPQAVPKKDCCESRKTCDLKEDKQPGRDLVPEDTQDSRAKPYERDR